MIEDQIRDDLREGTRAIGRLLLDARDNAKRFIAEYKKALPRPNRCDEFLTRVEKMIQEVAEG